MTTSQTIGQHGERLAVSFLQQNGLSILKQNHHSRYGEIDIIAKDQDMLVFIEVRVRNNLSYGDSLESITPAKQEKVTKTVLTYIQQTNYTGAFRIDVIGIEALYSKNPLISWVKNAFS